MTIISPHFTLEELTATKTKFVNTPTPRAVAHLCYGVYNVLEPAREAVSCPIIVQSGFRTPAVNSAVGGVYNSQHLDGCAADIRPETRGRFNELVNFLSSCPHVDQLLTGSDWCHVSWSPYRETRRYVRLGYYR